MNYRIISETTTATPEERDAAMIRLMRSIETTTTGKEVKRIGTDDE